MRKSLLLSTLLFAVSAYAADNRMPGQSSTKMNVTGMEGVSINPVIGLSIFSITDTPSSVSNTTGFAGGALVDIDTSVEPLKIETGLLFTQEGASADGATLTNNYILIPALAKYNVIQSNGSSLYVKGGLAPAFLMTSKATQGSFSMDMKSQFNTFDAQAMLGLGGVIANGANVGVTMDLTYIRGLLTANNQGTINAHNQGVMLSGGVIF